MALPHRQKLFSLAICINLVGILNFWLGSPSAASPIKIDFSLDSSHPRPRLSKYSKPVAIVRPPLESIVQGWNISGDPSFLLDFAVIGFPKCGTSSMMWHLNNHPQVNIFSDERCDLGFNQQAKLIKDLYVNMSSPNEDGSTRRGLKCPANLENSQLGMTNYQKYFPNTNYIVGIRHPVLWFESFYNFRIHNEVKMPPPETLIGHCARGSYNVCSFRGNFHIFLSSFGKTNMTTSVEEQQFVMEKYRKKLRTIMPDGRPVPQKVFLYEVSQLNDPDEHRSSTFLSTLQKFLGLTIPMNPMIWFKPGKSHSDERKLKKLNEQKINICDARYEPLRKVLQEQAVNASRWIRKYFLDAPGVVVSSKEHFKDVILTRWENDPCLERKRRPHHQLLNKK